MCIIGEKDSKHARMNSYVLLNCPVIKSNIFFRIVRFFK